MNTITSIKPYANLKSVQASEKTNLQVQPAFKGEIGKKVVQQVVNKEALTIAGVLAMVTGLIGLSKEKVSDVIEELMNKLKDLTAKNTRLEEEKKTLEMINAEKIDKITKEKTSLEENANKVISQKDEKIAEQKTIIEKKDADIAKLEKYKAMAYVKSVEELDIVTPEEFLATLKEAKEAVPEVEKNMIEFLFKGAEPKEVIKQLERNNKIIKAKKDGITNISELKQAYENSGIYFGVDSYLLFQHIMSDAIFNEEKGTELSYTPIMQQVLRNADAFSETIAKKNAYYPKTNGGVLFEVVNKTRDLLRQKEDLINQGYKFEGKGVNTNGVPFYTFSKDGIKTDLYLHDLARGYLGFARYTDPDGSVRTYTKANYW